ncbi:MAG: RNA-binding transcriptional accessory protein [Methanosarcinales archaeon]|nr:RNA-binding transcriptional accessory protein [Methanosarcinales archaeon]
MKDNQFADNQLANNQFAGHTSRIARELSLRPGQVQAAAELLDQEATVPFIARYRKEATGSLDEVAITAIRDRLKQLRELDLRREAILKSLRERDLLTDELQEQIEGAQTLAQLEDIYLPYRPRRRTRATVAREKGLEPLARAIFEQGRLDLMAEAASYVDSARGVAGVDEALSGARDIMAEWISENVEARRQVRDLFVNQGVLRCRSVSGKEDQAAKYRDYNEWSEPISCSPSHRVLAMLRGEKEGLLSLHLGPEDERSLSVLDSLFVHGTGESSQQVRLAARDGYRRLLAPSMEREALNLYKEKADHRAIAVFAQNLRHLLLEPPLGQKNVLAVDPGFRTGCKLAVLDSQGSLVHSQTIYPHQPQCRTSEAAETTVEICQRFGVEVIAVGNGTAGRETESFLRGLKYPWEIPVLMVNESGASVYSASPAAREEFPDQDVTVRGAVSIGRRLMDPLAELVKIDPKSIGVGQYQHDVDQKALKARLDDVVASCVNLVGVDVNTASKELLAYVSGLGPRLAEAVMKYRSEHGPFRNRVQLKKVPRLGPRAFQQAAGFLRIHGGDNPLDMSAVHPESYAIVEAMARDLGASVEELLADSSLQKRIDLSRYVTDQVGMPTREDILEELSRPGRDPRQKFEAFTFAREVEKPEDLKPGMKLSGIVTNVTAFGAFVDVGVHQDGLVHISQLANRFVRDPAEVVRVHQQVTVTVLDVDLERKRISLSMKEE